MLTHWWNSQQASYRGYPWFTDNIKWCAEASRRSATCKKIVRVLPRTVHKHRRQLQHIEVAALTGPPLHGKLANPIASTIRTKTNPNLSRFLPPFPPNPSPTYINSAPHSSTSRMKFLSELFIALDDTVSSCHVSCSPGWCGVWEGDPSGAEVGMQKPAGHERWRQGSGGGWHGLDLDPSSAACWEPPMDYGVGWFQLSILLPPGCATSPASLPQRRDWVPS